jgi:hypothetical protein
VDVGVGIGVGVGVGVDVGVDWGVGVGVDDGVDMGVGVRVGVGADIGVGDKVGVGVRAAVGVGVSVGIDTRFSVDVGVDVRVGVDGGIRDGVRVDGGVRDAVGCGVAIDTGISTGVDALDWVTVRSTAVAGVICTVILDIDLAVDVAWGVSTGVADEETTVMRVDLGGTVALESTGDEKRPIVPRIPLTNTIPTTRKMIPVERSRIWNPQRLLMSFPPLISMRYTFEEQELIAGKFNKKCHSTITPHERYNNQFSWVTLTVKHTARRSIQ